MPKKLTERTVRRSEPRNHSRRRHGRLSRPAAALVMAATLVASLGCNGGNNGSGASPTDPPIPIADFSFLAGTWSGTWKDTRYNVSGTLQATFTVTGASVSATGVIGLQSLGLGNENGSGSGTVSGDTLSFTFSAATVGTGKGTLKLSGAASSSGNGDGSVTGTLNFGGFTFAGTANGTTISGTFQFTSATGGNGVADLTKQ